jgi:transcriptional regulator with XRE-family HTH domain
VKAPPELERNSVSERLRLARREAGLSQLAVATALGIHRPSLSQIESGKRKVSADELAKLAEIYSVSVSWLLAIDDTDVRLERAARELANLKPEDLQRLLTLLATMRRPRPHS